MSDESDSVERDVRGDLRALCRTVLVLLAVVLLTSGSTVALVGGVGGTAPQASVDMSSAQSTMSFSGSQSVDEIRIGVGRSEWEGTYSVDDDPRIFVAALNTSGPVPEPVTGVDISITVHTPTGDLVNHTVTTGSDGAANLTVNPSAFDSPNGTWEVGASVGEHAARAEFKVGTSLEFHPGYGAVVDRGKSVTVALSRTSAFEPASLGGQNITITAPDGSQQVEQIPTDTSGVGEVTFTPSQEGRYSLKAEGQADTAYLRILASDTRAKVTSPDDFAPGQDAVIGGYVVTDDQSYANKQLTIQIIRETDDGEETLQNLTVTTGDTGQFLVTWAPPSNQTPEHSNVRDYDLRFYDANGERIPTKEGGLEYWFSETGPTAGLSVQVRSDDYQYSPGTTHNVTVTVTENGSAVANAEVTLGAVMTDGEIPFAYRTVTTDSDGTVTTQIDIPENAPSTDDYNVVAFAQKDSKNGSDTLWAEITRRSIDEEMRPREPLIGEQVTFATTVTDTESGNPISGQPVTWVAIANGLHSTVVDSGVAQTNDTGVATGVFDTDGHTSIRVRGKTPETELYEEVSMLTDKLQVNGLDEHEYAPGETVSFNVSSSYNQDVRIMMVVHTWEYRQTDQAVLATEEFAPGEQVSFTVPSDAEKGRDYSVYLTAVTADGMAFTERRHFDVGGDTEEDTQNSPPTASLTVSKTTVTVGQNVTFDASGSTDSDGTIEKYRWDFDGDSQVDATGSVISHAFDSAGTYNVTLGVRDNDGAHDLANVTITVEANETNQAPNATFTVSSTNATAGQNVTFDASGSTDAEGSVASYAWDFDGDGTVDATGETVTHAFESSGNYTVTLTVTDGNGATANATATVTVAAASEQSGIASYAGPDDHLQTSELQSVIVAWARGNMTTDQVRQAIIAWARGEAV